MARFRETFINPYNSARTVQSIPTPYGTIHVWLPDGPYGMDDILLIEIDEDAGGFKVPQGETIFTRPPKNSFENAGMWSIHSGFLVNDFQMPEMVHRVGKTKRTKKLPFNSIEFQFLSDELFNMLAAGILPFTVDPLYIVKAQQAVKDYYVETDKVEKAIQDLNDLQIKFNLEAEKHATKKHRYRKFFPRVRTKYIV